MHKVPWGIQDRPSGPVPINHGVSLHRCIKTVPGSTTYPIQIQIRCTKDMLFLCDKSLQKLKRDSFKRSVQAIRLEIEEKNSDFRGANLVAGSKSLWIVTHFHFSFKSLIRPWSILYHVNQNHVYNSNTRSVIPTYNIPQHCYWSFNNRKLY